ncbi:MAG: hypothetical protein HYV33_06170 [Candidatus Kerfeldbacteria bacterium]|nr:hypothetical protein [Candidatus Kerfeldbacteria bacterium]
MKPVLLTSLIGLAISLPALAYQTQNLTLDYNKRLENGTQLGAYEVTDQGPTGGPVVIASQIVNLLLLLLGTFSLCLMFYGGYIWVMSRGNEEQAKRAKDIIIGTVTGLVVILASYSIMSYVFRSIVDITD